MHKAFRIVNLAILCAYLISGVWYMGWEAQLSYMADGAMLFAYALIVMLLIMIVLDVLVFSLDGRAVEVAGWLRVSSFIISLLAIALSFSANSYNMMAAVVWMGLWGLWLLVMAVNVVLVLYVFFRDRIAQGQFRLSMYVLCVVGAIVIPLLVIDPVVSMLEPDYAQCKADPDERCVFALMQKRGDEKFCQLLPIGNRKDICLKNVFDFESVDCSQYSVAPDRDGCYANNGRSMNACDMVVNTTLKYSCIGRVALRLNDKELCDTIPVVYKQKMCRDNFGKRSMDEYDIYLMERPKTEAAADAQTSKTCVDDDGGINTSIKAFIVQEPGYLKYQDACVNGTVLDEWYCRYFSKGEEGRPIEGVWATTMRVDCHSGCFDGVCV